MMAIAVFLSGIGLFAILSRPTLLGIILGFQMMTMGAGLVFVFAGSHANELVRGHVFASYLLVSAIVFSGSGLILTSRLFFLRKRAAVDEIRTLRN